MQHLCCIMLLLVLMVSTSWADQAVITYRSGKTQTIQLEESADTIQGIRYLKEITPESLKPALGPDKHEQLIAPASKEPQKGTNPRLKWGKPIQGE